MIPIGQYTQDGFEEHNPEYFVKHFLAICEEHRSENRALLFAFLLYDFKHPQVIKVLEDVHYWNGLDSLSGSTLSVFAFHSPASSIEEPTANRLPEFNDPVARILSEHFGIADATMPTLLFFQIADEAIVAQHLVQLRADTIEAAFNEINSVLNDAVESVADVTPENYGNAEGIFHLVSERLRQRQTIETVQRGLKTFTSVTKLANFFSGM